MIDLGTGNNNKMCVVLICFMLHDLNLTFLVDPRNWAMDNKQEVCLFSIFSEITLININI
jgi:hypothetical protein